jgi:hypothetical protein
VSKRYVLFFADGDVSEGQIQSLQSSMEGVYGKVRVFGVKGVPKAVIVRTTNAAVPALRDPKANIVAGERRLVPVLTSGAVGNLKKRARGVGVDGQVHER